VRVEGREQLEQELSRIAAPILRELGAELVDLAVRGPRGNRIVRLDVDRPGPRGIDVADCQTISQRLGAALDDADLFASHYTLEVSSPGIERPIRTADDIRRNTGRRIDVACAAPDGAERSVRGLLLGQQDDGLLLETSEGARVRSPLAEVRFARQAVGY
jgi:ribosome maturation factor RimP